MCITSCINLIIPVSDTFLGEFNHLRKIVFNRISK